MNEKKKIFLTKIETTIYNDMKNSMETDIKTNGQTAQALVRAQQDEYFA